MDSPNSAHLKMGNTFKHVNEISGAIKDIENFDLLNYC
jgi:hypothetical protein